MSVPSRVERSPSGPMAMSKSAREWRSADQTRHKCSKNRCRSGVGKRQHAQASVCQPRNILSAQLNQDRHEHTSECHSRCSADERQDGGLRQ
jgi:hypothetical protein